MEIPTSGRLFMGHRHVVPIAVHVEPPWLSMVYRPRDHPTGRATVMLFLPSFLSPMVYNVFPPFWCPLYKIITIKIRGTLEWLMGTLSKFIVSCVFFFVCCFLDINDAKMIRKKGRLRNNIWIDYYVRFIKIALLFLETLSSKKTAHCNQVEF